MSSLFSNPWMLAALAAALLPWLIEWLFRRRKRQVELPTLRYLLRSKQQEQIKRQDRILLLLRTLAVILIALTLARPLLQQRWLSSGAKRSVLILLDATTSMNQQVGVTTAFGLAQKKAANLVRGLPTDTEVSVAVLRDRAEPLLMNQPASPTVAGRIEALRAPGGSAPMRDALAWAKVAAAKDAQPELYIFSDFQQHTWKRPGGDSVKDAQALADSARACETFLVDTASGAPAFNYILSALRPEKWLVTTGAPVKFSLRVECRGKAPDAARANVTFLVDGAKKDVREVHPGEQPSVVEFEHRFPNAGEHLVEALIDGDEHPIDNRQLYLCTVLDEARVLVIDDSGESLFLSRAIAPPTRPGADKVSSFSVKTIVPTKLAYESLDAYSAVILNATAALTPDIAARLERYVSGGGCAWFFLGPEANAYEYNKLLYKEGKGLLPGRLAASAENAAAPAHLNFSATNLGTNPALVALAASAANTSAEVSRYMPLELKPDAGAEVILSLSNGAPAIVERPFARGRVLLFNHTAGPAWTHLPALPEFPILVQTLLTQSVGNPDARVNLAGGERFESRVFVSSQHLLLKCPDGRKERLTPQPESKDIAAAESWRLTFDATSQPGIYEFAGVPSEVLPRRRFAVNPGTEEGDLTRLTERELRDFAPNANFTWSAPADNIEELAAKLHSVTELSPWLLAILTAILAVESLLAARFGRRRSVNEATDEHR